MENKFNSIDDVFRQSLQNFKAEPPAYVWDNINGKLDKLDGKRRFRLIWIFGSVAALFTAFSGGYLLSELQHSQQLLTSDAREAGYVSGISGNHQQLAGLRVQNNDFSGGLPGDNSLSPGQNTGMQNQNGYAHNTGGRNSGTTTKHGNADVNNTMAGTTGTTSGSEEELTNKTNKTKDSGYFSNAKPELGKKIAKSDDKGSETPVTTGETITPAAVSGLSPLVDPAQEEMNGPKQELGNNRTDANGEKFPVESRMYNLMTGDTPKTTITLPVESFAVLSVMPYFAPMYTIRNSSGDNNGYSPAFGPEKNFDEPAMFSYAAGVILGYNFSKKFSIHVGAAYNQFSNYTNRNDIQTVPFEKLSVNDTAVAIYTSAGRITGITIDPKLATPEGQAPTLSTDEVMNAPLERIVQTLAFVEVPVLARYKFFGERFGLTLTAGMSTGFLVRNDAYAENENERLRVGETDKVRNVNFNAIVGVGMEIKLTPWLYFNLEPTFKYSLLNWSVDNDHSFRMNPMFFSVNTGFSFKL